MSFLMFFTLNPTSYVCAMHAFSWCVYMCSVSTLSLLFYFQI
jgi:hypothetical protein